MAFSVQRSSGNDYEVDNDVMLLTIMKSEQYVILVKSVNPKMCVVTQEHFLVETTAQEIFG